MRCSIVLHTSGPLLNQAEVFLFDENCPFLQRPLFYMIRAATLAAVQIGNKKYSFTLVICVFYKLAISFTLVIYDACGRPVYTFSL